ncbi:MAG TPA: exopolyphosphatase [Frankiaceae bacterium]|nr:exopolyphosphatase [Frankiaceae bacterium]
MTRSDFDGLVCAMLLKELGMVGEIVFVHPKDVQDGVVDIGPGDILTNLPYDSRAHLVFDHHASEITRNGIPAANHVIIPDAPSAARVVFEYYGGADRFHSVPAELMRAVDQADSARYNREDVLDPQGWTLLNFVMDSRTGLGRFRNFRVSNYQLMMDLIDICGELPVDAVLALPDVAERVALYRTQNELFVEQLQRVSRAEGRLVVVDLRGEDTIQPGNRFMIYALYPECEASAHLIPGKQNLNTVIAVGKSILRRGNKLDIGALMLTYGGGGHPNAGTCQLPHEDAEAVLTTIAAAVNAPAED